MRISSKTRYGLASMIIIAQSYKSGEFKTIISIAEELDISKIYLEQVFSLLKRANIVISAKGSQGGYRLAKPPEEISVLEIFKAIEQIFFEATQNTVPRSAEYIEKAMQDLIFSEIDKMMRSTLEKISLQDLVIQGEKNKNNDNLMFFI